MDPSSALSVTELYDELSAAIGEVFPARSLVWVRGDIQKISESRGHRYIDLVDPDKADDRWPTKLSLKCWKTTWDGISRELESHGVALTDGMSVVVGGEVDLFRARGELSLNVKKIAMESLLGRLAIDRAKLVVQLQKEGLFEANRALETPQVPLHVGLVASWDTEGCNDFLGQLENSPFAFRVSHVQTSVQGGDAPEAIARALQRLEAEAVDLIVLVRGGGSKGDLAAFDSEPVARAIARAHVAVWTGIGHSGDRSIADDVASFAAITPTACGHAVVSRVGAYAQGVSQAALQIADESLRITASIGEEQARARRLLVATARARLDEAQGRVTRTSERLPPLALEATLSARRNLGTIGMRVMPLAKAHLKHHADHLEAVRRLCHAHDPSRLLAAGYSITRNGDGALVRGPEDVQAGGQLVTTVAGGRLISRVEKDTEGELT